MSNPLQSGTEDTPAQALRSFVNVPLDSLVASMASGIAEAQQRLDRISLEMAYLLSGAERSQRITFGNNKTKTYSLLDLGLRPSFYQFVDAVIEIKLAVSMTREASSGSARPYQMNGATIDAAYANRYQYSIEGASLVRTRLVPVPPPAALEQRVQHLLETLQAMATTPSNNTG